MDNINNDFITYTYTEYELAYEKDDKAITDTIVNGDFTPSVSEDALDVSAINEIQEDSVSENIYEETPLAQKSESEEQSEGIKNETQEEQRPVEETNEIRKNEEPTLEELNQLSEDGEFAQAVSNVVPIHGTVTTDDIGVGTYDEKENEHSEFNDPKIKLDDNKKTNLFHKGKALLAITGIIGAFGLLTVWAYKMYQKEEEKRNQIEENVNYNTETPTYDTTLGYEEEVNPQEELDAIEKKVSQDWSTLPKYEEPTKPQSRPVANNTSSSVQEVVKAPLRKKGLIKEQQVQENPLIPALSQNQTSPRYSTPLSVGMPSKEEYISSALAGITRNNEASQYERVNNGRITQNGAYEHDNEDGGKITMLGKNVLFPGTVIDAVLISGINTDYPANIIARVTENVYDSETGKNLLIPQGSLLQGAYSSSSIGISKVQVAWDILIISKNGISYMTTLGGMAGVDAQGNAGIKGSINDHYFSYLKAAGIMAMFTVITSEIESSMAGKTKVAQDVIEDTNTLAGSIGEKLVNRVIDVQPTVTVKNGTRISVSVNTPLPLIPFDSYKAKERFVR